MDTNPFVGAKRAHGQVAAGEEGAASGRKYQKTVDSSDPLSQTKQCADTGELKNKDSYSFDSKYEVGDCLLSNFASE